LQFLMIVLLVILSYLMVEEILLVLESLWPTCNRGHGSVCLTLHYIKMLFQLQMWCSNKDGNPLQIKDYFEVGFQQHFQWWKLFIDQEENLFWTWIFIISSYIWKDIAIICTNAFSTTEFYVK
jgi:hypothetical protein